MNFLFTIDSEQEKTQSGLHVIMDSTRSNRLPSSQPPSQISRIPASSAVSPNAHPDEDWTKISDLSERRRIQNRIAQRNFRQKKKKQLGGAGKRAHSSSPDRPRTRSLESRELVPDAQRRSSGNVLPTASGAPVTPTWTAVPAPLSPKTPHSVEERYTLPSQPCSCGPTFNEAILVCSRDSLPAAQAGYTVAPSYAPAVAYTHYFQPPGQPGCYTPDPAPSEQLFSPPPYHYQGTEAGFHSPGGTWTPYDVHYTSPHSDYYAQISPQLYPFDTLAPEESTSESHVGYHQQHRRST